MLHPTLHNGYLQLYSPEKGGKFGNRVECIWGFKSIPNTDVINIDIWVRGGCATFNTDDVKSKNFPLVLGLFNAAGTLVLTPFAGQRHQMLNRGDAFTIHCKKLED